MLNLFGTKAIMATAPIAVAAFVPIKAATSGIIGTAVSHAVMPILVKELKKYENILTDGVTGILNDMAKQNANKVNQVPNEATEVAKE